MSYQLFTRVALKEDLPEKGLQRGDVATIVEAHVAKAGQEPGYSLEVFNAVGEILLVLRADDHCWCLPCGWVEPYESPVEAAVREAREETGLTVKPIHLVDVFYRAAGSYKGTHALIAVVSCASESMETSPFPTSISTLATGPSTLSPSGM